MRCAQLENTGVSCRLWHFGGCWFSLSSCISFLMGRPVRYSPVDKFAWCVESVDNPCSPTTGVDSGCT